MVPLSVSIKLLFCLFQDVMHTICSPYGQVQRIVVFKKSGVQSMVEYPFEKKKKKKRLTS